MMMPSIFNDDFFSPWMDFSVPDVEKTLYGKRAANLMKTDIKEKDNGYELAIDLPGFDKNEVNVELKDGYLTVSAAKALEKEEKDGKDADAKEKAGKYIRRERYEGSMSRSFYVGKNLTEEDIRGEYKNGILRLEVPKKGAVEEKKHYITIEG
jgi:HSP20 family protein